VNNIDLVKALHRIWNTGDLALIDSVYARDFIAHWPPSSEAPERHGIRGIRFGVGRSEPHFPTGMNMSLMSSARATGLRAATFYWLCLPQTKSGNMKAAGDWLSSALAELLDGESLPRNRCVRNPL
jgi:hypothetical protein